MDAQLRKQLGQILNVATLTAVSSFGDLTYGAPTPVACRLEDNQQDSDTPDGEQFISRKRIVTEAQINKTDRLWLPGDSTADASLARTPYSVQSVTDERGNVDHYEILV